ncbi:MAG: radical SAM protein [Candidatus Omnitrophica bacterium]|nr:radical SAM protein [Candidatus Omnitrophota bacterium]
MNNKIWQNLHNKFPGLGRLFHGLSVFKGHTPVSPRFILLFLTYKCNLNCPFCIQSREESAEHPDMTLDDARLIAANISRSFHSKPRIHLFGGEPTVNKDFLKILKLFSDSGFHLSLTTNGLKVKEIIKDLAACRGLKEINLSLNTLTFDSYLSTIQLLRKHFAGRKVAINLNCPVNASNQGLLAGIAARFRDSGADLVSFQHALFIEPGKNDLDAARIATQVEMINLSRKPIPVLFSPNILSRDIKSYYRDPAFPVVNKCIVSWLGLFIHPDGDVFTCVGMDVKMGNAKKEELKGIWNSVRYKKFRHAVIKDGVSHPKCQRCCHRQYY